MSTTVCQVFTTGTVKRFTAQSSTGIDNYESVLDVPAAAFTATHNYVLVIQGYVSISDPINGSADSVPFFGLYQNTSWPVAAPFSIRGTVRTQGGSKRVELVPYIGSYPFGTLLTDQATLLGTFFGNAGVVYATVLVWDLNNLSGESIPWFFTTSGGAFSFPVRGAPAAALSNGLLGSTGDWLLFGYAAFQPNAGGSTENNRANVWFESPSGTRIYTRDSVVLFSPGPAALRNQFCVGNVMAATFPATDVWMRGIDDLAPATGGQTQLVKSSLFAVKQDAKLSMISTPSTAGTVLSFYAHDFPWDGNAKELVSTPSYYYSDIVIGRAHAYVTTTPPSPSFPSTIQLEIDGEQIGGNLVRESMHAGGANSAEVLVPHHRIGLHSHGGGRHYMSLRGGTNRNLAGSFTVPDDGFDTQIIAFSGIVGIVPAAIAPEIPGPPTPIAVQRETTVAMASLPALPHEPDWQQAVTVQSERRDFATETGYHLSSYRFSKPIEGARLAWENRTATEADALIAFLTALATSGGAFRWRPPWEMDEVAWAVEDLRVPDENPSQRGHRSISIDALRLVHVAP